MMNFKCTEKPIGGYFSRSLFGTSFGLLTLLLVSCGGGGGGSVSEPEAFVQSVAAAQVLEGNSGTASLQFVVTLNKPVIKDLTVSFNTGGTTTPALDIPGVARGGVCTAAQVDYVAASSQISIAAGARTATITVQVCGDSGFEPSETLQLTWASPGTSGGVAMGTIINDDAGGLNGTGATNLLGGLSASGRDTNPLTNSSTDGALGFSFDNSNVNCVTDKVTGLVWQRVHSTTKTFNDLTAYVSSVNAAALCGLANWKVPTVDQLLSLMDASKTNSTAINADSLGAAGDAMHGQYWTIESRATAGATSVDAWQVDTSNGAAISYVNKTQPLGVRLVSGGTSSPPACNNTDTRFEDFGNGTVADRKTGLMWKKCPEGYTDTACSVGSVLSFNSDVAVVSRLNGVNTGSAGGAMGYSDWRVPTKSELASLVIRSCASPATIAAIFPSTDAVSFVTATLDADAPATRVWGVDFTEGSVGPALLSGPFRLRLVRAGQ